MAIIIITIIAAAAADEAIIKTHPAFEQVGSQMLADWRAGIASAISDRAESALDRHS